MSAEPVSSVRNLGPKSEEWFARAGITSADQLRKLGADEAYRRLLATGQRPHFIGYYVLVHGLQDRPWNAFEPGEKEALRARFDALVAESRATGTGAFEAELNRLGVVARRG
ncbi:MAG: TfoX/Sxy family DNA transformation protein [Pseudomonadota bacterium]